MTVYVLHKGNNMDVLPTLLDCSVDSIVTDPPYELGFMGKAWDSTGIAYNVDLWRECLRVLKPGGHLLAFGGTRTYHRMAVAIEDAGFDIRDSIHWLYGSGFPKSLDVSKAIDKRGGVIPWQKEFAQHLRSIKPRNITTSQINVHIANGTKSNFWGHFIDTTSQPLLPTVDQYQKLREILPIDAKWDALFLTEAEREVIGRGESGVAAAFGDGQWATTEERAASTRKAFDITAPATDAAKQWEGWGTALKPAHEPIVLARKPLTGTVAANILQHCTGALNIDACRIPMGDQYDPTKIQRQQHSSGAIDGAFGAASLIGKEIATYKPGGRWPANVIVDDTINDDWARYFYCAKPSKRERNAGLDGITEQNAGSLNIRTDSHAQRTGASPKQAANFHPTVKPLALMRYLIRLVTPLDGVVLDPFAGSGTTMVAAILEGFNGIGIELTSEYHPIIEARCNWAINERDNRSPALFE